MISFISKDSEALHVSPFETGTEVKVYQPPRKNMSRIYLVILQHCCARMQGCVSSAGNKLFGKQFVANCQCTVKVAQEKCKECDETVSYMVLLLKRCDNFPKEEITALCNYPLVKMEIGDSSQIFTTAAIFSQYDYFRQTIWKLASVQFHF